VPAQQAKPTTPATDKPKAERGTPPAHILLAAIKHACDARVDYAKISSALDFAVAAHGAAQSSAWKTVANMLDTYAKDAKPTETPSA
jgi:hypothetical protein